MKMKLIFLALLLLVVGFGVGLAQKTQQKGLSCGFAVEGESVEPAIKGPDDLLPLVYVVEQPDAPIEVVSVDLTGSWVSISNERTSHQFCAKYRVRNRSDQIVRGFEIMLMLSTSGAGGGAGAVSSSSVLPGQAAEVEFCGEKGGNGSAKDNYVRLLVYVDKVDFEDCHYKPSLRIPRSLGVHTVW